MHTPRFLRVVLLLVLFSGLGMSQGEPTVRVTAASLSGVSLEPYEPGVEVSFAKYFESHPAQAALCRFSAVVKNLSGRAVVGLGLRWTRTDQSGERSVTDLLSDGLFLSRQPVVAEGDTLLVTPDFILPQSMLGSGIMMPSSTMMARHAAQWSKASNVALDLDVVIFQGGSFAGPDRSGFVASIKARKQAALELSSAILRLFQNGQDPSAMVAEAVQQPAGDSDLVAAWKGRIAQMIQHGNLRLEAQALADVPDVQLYPEPTAQAR